MKREFLTRLVQAAILLLPLTSYSHALLVSPVPRDYGNDATVNDVSSTSGNTIGPCDPNLQAGTCASASCTYTAGATIAVTFEAVIQHAGPFKLSLGPAAATSSTPQTSFSTLMAPAVIPTSPFTQTEAQNADGTFNEPQKVNVGFGAPDIYNEYVVIPAATAPGNYTMQLQQADGGTTYFTCADITVTAAGGTPSPTPSATPSISPSPGSTGGSGSGGGPNSAQSTGGNSPAAQNGGAKMASCGSVHDNSNGPGRGPGSAAMIFLPLILMLWLRQRAMQPARARATRR